MAIVQSIFFLFCYFRLAEISPVICTSCRYPLSGSMILARVHKLLQYRSRSVAVAFAYGKS